MGSRGYYLLIFGHIFSIGCDLTIFFPIFLNVKMTAKKIIFKSFKRGCFLNSHSFRVVSFLTASRESWSKDCVFFCIEKLALIGVAVIYVDIFSFLIPERSKRFTVFLRGGNLSRKTSYPYFSCIISFLFSQLFFLK